MPDALRERSVCKRTFVSAPIRMAVAPKFNQVSSAIGVANTPYIVLSLDSANSWKRYPSAHASANQAAAAIAAPGTVVRLLAGVLGARRYNNSIAAKVKVPAKSH